MGGKAACLLCCHEYATAAASVEYGLLPVVYGLSLHSQLLVQRQSAGPLLMNQSLQLPLLCTQPACCPRWMSQHCARACP